MKFISNLVIAAIAAMSMLAAGAPANAQSKTFNAIGNVVLQGGLVDDGQVAKAVADAASTGSAVTSTAVADATGLNLVNTSTVTDNINAAAYQVNGKMDNVVVSLVGQIGIVDGGQYASATANARAQAATNATALAANIVNSSGITNNVTSATNRH